MVTPRGSLSETLSWGRCGSVTTVVTHFWSRKPSAVASVAQWSIRPGGGPGVGADELDAVGQGIAHGHRLAFDLAAVGDRYCVRNVLADESGRRAGHGQGHRRRLR